MVGDYGTHVEHALVHILGRRGAVGGEAQVREDPAKCLGACLAQTGFALSTLSQGFYVPDTPLSDELDLRVSAP